MSDKGSDQSPVVVAISGDFSFTTNRGFRAVLDCYPKGERVFVADLAGVEELDSSALGMLLQLRDHSIDGTHMTVINYSAQVRAALAEAEAGKVLLTDD